MVSTGALFEGASTSENVEIFVVFFFVFVLFFQANRPSCTAITKQLKFYTKTSHVRGPSHFAGRVTSSSSEIGKYSATNIGKIAIHVFILQTCKRSHDGGVINYYVALTNQSYDQV